MPITPLIGEACILVDAFPWTVLSSASVTDEQLVHLLLTQQNKFLNIVIHNKQASFILASSTWPALVELSKLIGKNLRVVWIHCKQPKLCEENLDVVLT